MARSTEIAENSQKASSSINGENLQRASSSITRLRARPDPFLVVCRCFSVITSLSAILCIFANVLSAIRSFKNGSDIFDGIFRCYAIVLAIFVVVAETEWGFVIKFWKEFDIIEQKSIHVRAVWSVLVISRLGISFTDFYPIMYVNDSARHCFTFQKFFQSAYRYLEATLSFHHLIRCLCLIYIIVLEYWAGRGMLQIFVAVMTRAFPDYSGEQEYLVILQNIGSYLLLACGVVFVVSGILCIGSLKRARLKKETSRDQAVKDLEELERQRQELEALLVENRV